MVCAAKVHAEKSVKNVYSIIILAENQVCCKLCCVNCNELQSNQRVAIFSHICSVCCVGHRYITDFKQRSQQHWRRFCGDTPHIKNQNSRRTENQWIVCSDLCSSFYPFVQVHTSCIQAFSYCKIKYKCEVN